MSFNPWEDDNGKKYQNKSYKNEKRKPHEEFINMFQGGGGADFNIDKKIVLFILSLIFVIWIFSGFYIVNADETGIETVLGKYMAETSSGLQYNLPAPIAKTYKIKTTAVNKEVLGMKDMFSKKNNMDYANEEFLILTGDENMLDVSFEVQWRISNPKNYIFNVYEASRGDSVRKASESAMREVIGQSNISLALEGAGRISLSDNTKLLLQEILDSYNIGIEILAVQLKKVDPPEKVIDAFRDVQSARSDKERLINQAYSYKNSIIPQSRGEASVITQEAEAYKQEVINRAKGEASRFANLLEQHKKHKDITEKRMYLDAMESVLSSVEKVVIDKNIKGTVPLLPLSGNLSVSNKSFGNK